MRFGAGMVLALALAGTAMAQETPPVLPVAPPPAPVNTLPPSSANAAMFDLHRAFGSFSRTGGRNSNVEVQLFVTYRRTPGLPSPLYAARKGDQWAFSSECPALRDVLLSMEALPPPRIDAPRLGVEAENIVVTADPSFYRLTAPANFGSDDLMTEVSLKAATGPLAVWVENSLTALQLCWRTG